MYQIITSRIIIEILWWMLKSVFRYDDEPWLKRKEDREYRRPSPQDMLALLTKLGCIHYVERERCVKELVRRGIF